MVLILEIVHHRFCFVFAIIFLDVFVVEMHFVSSIGKSKAGQMVPVFDSITNSGDRLSPKYLSLNYVQILR